MPSFFFKTYTYKFFYTVQNSGNLEHKYSENILVLGGVAATEYHRLGSFNNKPFFLTVLQAEKSEVKVLADSIPGEGLLAECCLLAVSSYGGGRACASSLWSLYALNLI